MFTDDETEVWRFYKDYRIQTPPHNPSPIHQFFCINLWDVDTK